MDYINLSNANMIYTALLMLVISLGINVVLIFGSSKKPVKDQSPLLENKGIRDFVRQQIEETRKHLKQRPEGEFTMDNKVVALRTAYLNVEIKALDKEISSSSYWKTIDNGIVKLLKLFLPQIYGRESHIQELESRIGLLTERINKLKGSKNSGDQIFQTVDSLKNIVPSIKKNQKAQAIVSKYMEKMEHAISSYENPKRSVDISSEKELMEKLKASTTSIDKLRTSLKRQNEEASIAEDRISNMISAREALKDKDQDDMEMITRLKEAEVQLREFQNKNKYLEKMVDKLKKKVTHFESNEETTHKAKPIITVTSTGNQGKSESSSDFDELTNQVNDIAEREISRLRNLLKEQDRSISDMGSELTSLKRKTNESEKLEEFQEQTIKKLRSHVKESDCCIKTLEKEIDELNKEIKDVNDSNKYEIDIYKSGDMEKLKNEIEVLDQDLKDSLDKIKDHNRLLSYYNESVDAGSIEDLAVLIFQNVEEMGCKANMWLTLADKEILMSESGALSTREKVVINNMKVGESNLGFEGRSLRFRFKNLKGLLVTENQSTIESQYKDILDFLKYVDKLSDKLFGKHKNVEQSKKMEVCSRSLKLIAYEVDQGIENQIKNSKDLVSTSFAQLTDLIRNAGVSPTIANRMESMENNALKQLDSEEMLKLKLRKQFLEILKYIDAD